MRKRTAMTLIELLVVIAIVGLLVGLLLPALQAARATSRNLTCKSNMRQIGIGIHQFANVNGGRFPFNVHEGLTNSWIYTLAPYLEDVNEIRMCPDDTKREERLNGPYKGTSYIINEFVTSLDVEGAVTNLHKLKTTTKVIMLMEGSDAMGITDDHAHVTWWYSPTNVNRGLVWNAMLNEMNPNRHGTFANYLYADGHVESLSASEMRLWIDKDIAEKTILFRPYN